MVLTQFVVGLAPAVCPEPVMGGCRLVESTVAPQWLLLPHPSFQAKGRTRPVPRRRSARTSGARPPPAGPAMRTDASGPSGLAQTTDDPVNVPAGEAATGSGAIERHEQGDLAVGCVMEHGPEGVHGCSVHGQSVPFELALCLYFHGPGLEIHVFEVEADHLAPSEATVKHEPK